MKKHELKTIVSALTKELTNTKHVLQWEKDNSSYWRNVAHTNMGHTEELEEQLQEVLNTHPEPDYPATLEDVMAIIDDVWIRSHSKAQLISLVRKMTGAGLVGCKNTVEEYLDLWGIETYSPSREGF